MLDRFAKSWFPLMIAAFGAALLAAVWRYGRSVAKVPDQPEIPLELILPSEHNPLFVRRLDRWGGYTLASGLALTALPRLVRLLPKSGREPPHRAFSLT